MAHGEQLEAGWDSKEADPHGWRATGADFVEGVGCEPGLEEGLDFEVLETEDILGQLNHKQGYGRATGRERPCRPSARVPSGAASKATERSQARCLGEPGAVEGFCTEEKFLKAVLKWLSYADQTAYVICQAQSSLNWVRTPLTYPSKGQ